MAHQVTILGLSPTMAMILASVFLTVVILAIIVLAKGSPYPELTVQSPGTGALPPYGVNWQMGKTAASIAFVRRAEIYLDDCDDPTIREKLQTEIDRIKLGEIVLNGFRTVKEFLENS